MNIQTGQSLGKNNHVLELIAGPFAEVVSQIWSGERFADYVTADDTRRHVWHCCLSADASPFIAHNPEQNELIVSRLTFGRSRDLLVQALGERPSGLIGFLSRLGPEARPPAIYRLAALAFQKGGGGARFLMHTKNPSNELITCAALAPRGLRNEAFAVLGNKRKIDPRELHCIGWTLERLEQQRGPDVVRKILNASSITDVLCDAIVDLPFPSPPWPETEKLRAISSSTFLKQTGLRFNNCLAITHIRRAAALQILTGFQYYYLWEADTPAILKFIRVLDVGWYLEDCLGPNNVDLPEKQKREMFDALSAPDCNARDLLVESGGSNGGVFWGEMVYPLR